MSTAPSAGEGYRLVHDRVVELVRAITAEQAELPVPTCPQWTVRQTLAHLAGVAADITAGRAGPAGEPEWTAAQVAARAHATVPDLVAEWSRELPGVIAAVEGRGRMGQVLMDALSHEYDLRNALGVPPPADDPLTAVALAWLTSRFSGWLDATGRPGLTVVTPHARIELGGTASGVELHAGELDLVRSLTGRRSTGQVRALDWRGDPDPWLPALVWGPFAPPAAAVEPLAG